MDDNLYNNDEVSEILYKFLSLDCIPEGKFLKITEEEMKKGPQCKICKGLVLNPVVCKCPDETSFHMVGKECAKKNFDKEKLQKIVCPHFYPLNTYFEDEFMKNQLDIVLITCPFCSFSSTVYKVRKHVLEECELDGKNVSCPFPECKKVTKRRDLRKHLLTETEKHINLLKGYGLNCYLTIYVNALSQRYKDLTKEDVKGE